MLHGTLRQGGTDTPATMENVQAALAGNDFFWLDLDDEATDGAVSDLLTEPVQVPPPGRPVGRAFQAAAAHRHLRRLRLPGGARRRPRAHGQGGGPLLLDGPLRRDGAPGEVPGRGASCANGSRTIR